MAKKGGPVHLQTEINNEEDWDKFLEREGLLIVDVYSDWCGPCSAMSGTLKKLKLETGGDDLQLAMAKSDNIEALKRFRDKSEPTWMFIADGKMVRLEFGADSPHLIRVVYEELKKERAAREGTRTREEMEITEMAPSEVERFEVVERVRLDKEAQEIEAKSKALQERRLLVSQSVLEALPFVGLVVVFPKARDAAKGLLDDIWEPIGIKLSTSDKVALQESDLDELLYFADMEFSENLVRTLSSDKCLAHLLKYKGENNEVDFDALILEAIYGPSKCPPGDKESPALTLQCKVAVLGNESVAEEEVETEEVVIEGVWVPPNRLCRAAALKIFFPATANPHVPPEPEAIPPYIAVCFDAIKRSDVMALVEDYPEDVMRFGFFTGDKRESAKLIAKNVLQFEIKAEETIYGERMILQLSKKHSDAILAFAQLGPTYMSINDEVGADDCAIFFPEGYDEPEVEEVVELEEKKKKRKKKKAKKEHLPEKPSTESLTGGQEEPGLAIEVTEGEIELSGILSIGEEAEMSQIEVSEGGDEGSEMTGFEETELSAIKSQVSDAKTLGSEQVPSVVEEVSIPPSVVEPPAETPVSEPPAETPASEPLTKAPASEPTAEAAAETNEPPAAAQQDP